MTYRVAAAVVLLVAPVLSQQPFELETDGDSVILRVEDKGIAMPEFIKLAQRVTGRAFTYSKKEIANAGPVKLVGQVRIKKSAFLQFFQTRLFLAGLATVTRDKGDHEAIEIVPLPASAHQGGTGPRYVAATELEAHKAASGAVLTSIALAHVAPKEAIARVRAALAVSPFDVALAHVAKKLLVQGAAADVYCVSRMVRLIDVPAVPVVEIVRLRHAAAADLVKGLEALIADRQAAVVVAHADTNSLLISGAAGVVREMVEIATLLDRPAEKKKR